MLSQEEVRTLYSVHLWLLSLIFIVIFTVKTFSAVLLHRPFYMMSLPPYWCPKTIKRHPCWCPKQSWGRWTLFLSPVQMDATLLANNSQDYWMLQGGWMDGCCTCCVHLHTLLYVVVHCSELLRKVWNQSNLWVNNSQHFFCSVITEALCNNRELKQQWRRRLQERHLKSEFAPLQNLSRLFHLVYFAKCWQMFLELNSKGLYQSSGKEKKVVVLCSRPRQNVNSGAFTL